MLAELRRKGFTWTFLLVLGEEGLGPVSLAFRADGGLLVLWIDRELRGCLAQLSLFVPPPVLNLVEGFEDRGVPEKD